MACHGDMPCDAWVAEMPSSPTSVAVSKPRPNRNPSGYMCQLLVMARNSGRNSRASSPRPDSSMSRAPSSSWPLRWNCRKLRQTPSRMTRLAAAIASRKMADTRVPTTPPIPLMASSLPCIAEAVAAMARDAKTTMVECPSENHRPTIRGRWPSCISLRTTLSIAAMWSASTAWRIPNTQASRAVPSSVGRSWNAIQAHVQAARLEAASIVNRPVVFGSRPVMRMVLCCLTGAAPRCATRLAG